MDGWYAATILICNLRQNYNEEALQWKCFSTYPTAGGDRPAVMSEPHSPWVCHDSRSFCQCLPTPPVSLTPTQTASSLLSAAGSSVDQRRNWAMRLLESLFFFLFLFFKFTLDLTFTPQSILHSYIWMIRTFFLHSSFLLDIIVIL